MQSIFISPWASALNIVLSNDDGWNTNNIKEMKKALMAAGHDVILSAPCMAQSGKGGSFTMLKNVNVDTSKASIDEYCVGDKDTTQVFKNFVEGSPVMAVLYGIDIAAQEKWGKDPDLVVSGPNEGNNLGYMNNNSGTLGATMIALSRAIPAIAISGDISSMIDDKQGAKISQVMVDIIDKLESSRVDGQPLLPAYMGLNINTPKHIDNASYHFTDVGWNAGGIILKFKVNKKLHTNMLLTEEGDAHDNDENSEGVALSQGDITISTIDGSVQATVAKVALTKLRLGFY